MKEHSGWLIALGVVIGALGNAFSWIMNYRYQNSWLAYALDEKFIAPITYSLHYIVTILMVFSCLPIFGYLKSRNFNSSKLAIGYAIVAFVGSLLNVSINMKTAS